MQNAVAFSNNDVITIAWSYDTKPVGCMGFAIYRIDADNNETALPSQAVFKGMVKKPGQTTEDFPIQKFYWKDVYARLIAEETQNRIFSYKIVPLKGKRGDLVEMKELQSLVTNKVEITFTLDPNITAYFNRGLISTQKILRYFKGNPNKVSLVKLVSDSSDKLRASLSGDMVEALVGFMDKAKNDGQIYAALYELGDEELIEKLEGIGNRLQIILSNSKKEVNGRSQRTIHWSRW